MEKINTNRMSPCLEYTTKESSNESSDNPRNSLCLSLLQLLHPQGACHGTSGSSARLDGEASPGLGVCEPDSP